LYVIIALLGIILLNQRQNMGTSTVQRQFNRMVYATIAVLAVDTACWLVDGTTFPHARAANIFIETWYYFFNGFMPFMWLVYTEITLSNDKKRARRRIRLLATLLVAYVGVLIWNLWSGWVFEISQQNIYRRGTGYAISAVIAYTYLSYTTVHALIKVAKNRWSSERRQYFMMAAFIIPPMIGGIIQMLYFGVNYIWISTVISAVLFYIDMLNRQISTEELTGLNNRRELNKFLIREIRDNSHAKTLALVMMDIDHFKDVNDTYGHYYGDCVLVTVSDILKKSCNNTSAFLSRIGGDEFCIVCSMDDSDGVEGLIARIQYNIVTWNASHRDMVQISLSIGYSVWDPEKDQNFETLYRRADQNMYRAKRSKKLSA